MAPEFVIRAEVRLKRHYRDPEGEAAAEALRSLGYPVKQARVSKVYEVVVEARSLEEARRIGQEACRKLLANPVKDDWSVEVIG